MANRSLSKSNYPDIGTLGEDLVAKWLQLQGWAILHRRWYCRWGELDIIARRQAELVFVEVKTRQRKNWDADGLLAITASKQAKLWQAAELFLADRPELAELDCRFDVALVRSDRFPAKLFPHIDDRVSDLSFSQERSNHQDYPYPECTLPSGYRLSLQQYIQSAFGH